jgi:hypothetical protein
MNTPTITEVSQGTITLPRSLRREWNGARVYLDVRNDTIVAKRLEKPRLTLSMMMDEFKRAARETGLTRATATNAISNLRRNRQSQTTNARRH